MFLLLSPSHNIAQEKKLNRALSACTAVHIINITLHIHMTVLIFRLMFSALTVPILDFSPHSNRLQRGDSHIQKSEVPGVGSGRADEYQVSGRWLLRCGAPRNDCVETYICGSHSTFSSTSPSSSPSLLPPDNHSAPLSASQALLAVLLLEHRCSHLRCWQQRPRQDGHLKVWAGGHVGGKWAHSQLQP